MKKHKSLAGLSNDIIRIFVMAAVLCTTLVFPQSAAGGNSFYELNITVSTESVVSGGQTVSKPVIQLKWPDYIPGKCRYNVERKEDLGSFTKIATVYPSTYYTSSPANREASYTDRYYSLKDNHMYTYRISYTDWSSGTEGSTVIYTEEVQVVFRILQAPDTLTVTPAASGRMDLKWTYPGAAQSATVIERKEGVNGEWRALATVPMGVTSYSDTGLSAIVEYFYRVKAQENLHVFSNAYPEAGISKYAMLNAPRDFSGYALSPTQIHLTWSDSYYENAYVIQRKERGVTSFSDIITLQSNVTSWIDTGLKPNTFYVYRIKAQNGDSISEYSPEITISSVYVEKPTELTALIISKTKAELKWRDNSRYETGFEIWRKAGQKADWVKYATTHRNAVSFIDDDISQDITYYYKVRSRISDSDSYSAFSNEAYAWATTIAPPSDLKYSIEGAYIKLSWKDNSTNESGFQIEMKTGLDGRWVTYAWPYANTTSYTLPAPLPGGKYFFRVKGVDNTSANSAAYSEEIFVDTVIPEAPSDLKVEAISHNQIRLTWKDNSNNEEGFKISRRLSGSVHYREVATTKSNVTTYTETNLASNVQYSYRITAFNKSGQSNYSNEEDILTGKFVTFKDISDLTWAKESIENLAGRGVFKAAADGKFRPSEEITRGEFISILVKTFNMKGTAVGAFKDVGPRHQYYNEIMTADKNGIITESGGYFYPDRLISRQDMAVFLAKTLNASGKPLPYYDISILDEYSDVDKISPYAVNSLASFRGENLITGEKVADDKWLIRPLKNTTRAEAAVMVYRALKQ